MECRLCTEKDDLNPFVPQSDWSSYRRQWASEGDGDHALEFFASRGILPTYEAADGRLLALRGDLSDMPFAVSVVSPSRSLFDESEDWRSASESAIRDRRGDTRINLPATGMAEPLPRVFFPAVRNLLALADATKFSKEEAPQSLKYFGPTLLISRRPKVVALARDQLAAAARIDHDSSFEFANSAYYMGTKRSLASFLMEASRRVLPPRSVVLDLMCGSGAAARAYSHQFEVIAADALSFCSTLARCMGGGYTVREAELALESIAQNVRANFELLRPMVSDSLEKEQQFLHRELDQPLLDDYIAFAESTPRYIDIHPSQRSSFDDEILQRRKDPRLRPYCLVSTYWSNVYFGVAQSAEIDSIRFAIDQLHDEKTQQFALGALLAACSKLSSGYGGHFAQPLRLGSLSPVRLANLLEIRAQSIYREFSVRFLALAGESERSSHEIRPIVGGWDLALKAAMQFSPRPTAVYLDAPYTRDEYSRYYHVLESLSRYNYPFSRGIARGPDRKRDDYFTSPFFTKDTAKTTRELIRIIQSVLDVGLSYLQSYSPDPGAPR